MKYIILSILVLFSLSAYSQIEDTPLFVGKYFGNQSGGGSGYWQVTGNFTDESGYYDATSIQVGDVLFFVDAGIGYHLPVTTIVSASGSSFTIRVNNTGISGVAGVPNGPGGIYRANSPKGIWPFTAGLTASDQQTLNSFLIKRLNNEPVKRDTFITVPHSTNYIPNLVITTPSRFYNNIYISCKGISDTSTVAFLAAPTSSHYGVVYNIKNDSGLVETRVLSDAHLSNTKTSYLLRPGQMAQVRALKDQRQAGAYKWAVNLLWDSTATGGGSGITALTGDVTASGTGSVAATIANNAVTSAKVASQTLDSTDLKNRGATLLKLAQSGATNGQVPKYNSTTGNWEPGADNDSGGGGSAENTRLAPKRVALIIFAGESNSGGLGVNALASAPELAAQQYVRIFNPTTRTLQQLDIGTNNLIGHSSFPENATHGWELELANQAFARFADTVILVKCGQGGSTISQWVKGTTPMYYDTAISRINKTISLLKAEGKQVDMYLWWSQGINDAEASVSAATWATNTKKVFANFRRDLGSFPIIMTRLLGSGNNYDATLTGTLKNRDDGIFHIYTPQSSVGDSLLDVKHWNYLGLKAVANRFLNVTDSIGSFYNYQRNVKTGGVITNSGVLEAHGTDQAQIKTAGVTAVSVTTGQQVGVGNNTPGATSLLSVGSSTFTHSQLQVGRGGNGGMYHLSFTDDIGIISQGASFGASGFTARSTSAMNYRMDNGAHIFQANTGLTIGNTFSPTQLGKWNATGFRIGTGDPAYKLDVDGTGNFTGVLSVANFLRSTGASATLQTEDRSNSAKRVSIFMNSGIALFNTTDYTAGYILFDNATGNTGVGGTTPTTSRFTLPASTTAGSSLRILAGVAPTTPVNGDIWSTSAEVFSYLGGVTTTFIRGYKGSGTPESAVTAPVGSIFQRSDGAGSTILYGKITGAGNTGWAGFYNVGSPLVLPAGTATASTAPLKFTSGTNLTTPEAGALEYDGTEFYATNSTASRTILPRVLKGSATLDFGSTAAGAVTDLTITVTGAADGDVVSLSVPNASQTTTGTFSAWVSAADTVTVRYRIAALTGSEDPASGTFKVTVTK